jgi:PAS domain S-box-containing protein
VEVTTLPVGSNEVDIALAILNGMPDATVLVGSNGNVVFASARIEYLLGWRPADLVDRCVDVLVPTDLAARHSGLREQFARNSGVRLMGSGIELDALHRDGTLVPVEISLSPVLRGGEKMVIAVIREATVQRELRAAVIRERDRAHALIEGLRDGLIEFDPTTLKYLTANARFCQMVGLTADQVLSVTGVPPWWDPSQVEEITAFREAAARGEIHGHEISMVSQSGRRFQAMVTPNVLKNSVGSTMLVQFHDLTDELRAAEELEHARSLVAVLEDRDRIARDLHDGVIQRLFAAGLHLQASIGRPNQEARLIGVIDEIDTAIKEIRTTIFTLHRQRGIGDGLEHALRIAIAQSSRLLGFQPELRLTGDLDLIPDDLRAETLSLVSELLSNVAKHAHASWTAVYIDVEPTHFSVRADDNGVGFDAQDVVPGDGVRNLRERADRRGGTLTMEPLEPRGVSVCWRVPVGSVLP